MLMLSQFVIFELTGLLQIVLSVPMVQRRVKRNHLYGFRTRKTLRDDRTWYAANEYCGKLLIVAGAVQCIGSILLLPVCYFLPESVGIYALSCTAVILTSVTYVLVRSFAFLKRL